MINKVYTAALGCLLMATAAFAQEKEQVLPAVIPAPVSVQPTKQVFNITPVTKLVCDGRVGQPLINLLHTCLTGLGGKRLQQVTTGPAANYIILKIDTAVAAHAEGYQLTVDEKGIQLLAHDAGGLLYGIQTLRQLVSAGSNTGIKVPGCIINDYPRFGYRGMALDVCRHMFPVAFIKQYIDVLSFYKFNTFHWHITDDQGWRIEIKKYPKLQSVAAWRNETLIGHKKELPHRFDGKRYGGYYTQQQVKELVQYAADRNITIIPEIEMPGHASAALTAYPGLGCTGGPYKTATFWGVFDEVYCAGNDSTFSFLQNVLDEVMALFPSKYIHIGGDECPKTRWQACPKCQQRITSLGLKDEHALQSYFVQRIEQYVNSKGRNIIGWDEILEGGLAPNATVMSWRGEEGGRAAMAQHHPVVMTPESHCYFDYYPSLYSQEQVAAGGYTSLKKVYTYEPAADSATTTTAQYLAGVEGQAWSEYFANEARAGYMVFPRAVALAEVGWSPAGARNYDDFLHRLRLHDRFLQPIHYNKYFDDIRGTITQGGGQQVQLTLQTTLPGATIRYTTNNDQPTRYSTLYTGPVTISKTSAVKALVFNSQQQAAGRLFQQNIRIHKAVGAKVILTNKPIERFNPGSEALVNGVYGSNRYNDNQWLGFSGDDLEAVIDLGSVQSIQRIGLNVLNYHWQRMWAPVTLHIFATENGAHFTEIYKRDTFSVNGINTVEASFKPMQARYIKIVGTNKGVIPAGEYGAGGKALLLIDEVIVD